MRMKPFDLWWKKYKRTIVIGSPWTDEEEDAAILKALEETARFAFRAGNRRGLKVAMKQSKPSKGVGHGR